MDTSYAIKMTLSVLTYTFFLPLELWDYWEMTYSIMLYGKMLGLNKESVPLKWQTWIFPFNMKFATKRDDISSITVLCWIQAMQLK